MRTYRLQDIVKNVESTDAWSHGIFQCVSCRKKLNNQTLKTNLGQLCVPCVEAELKKNIRPVDLTGWSSAQFLEALEALGTLRNRLMVLWRFHDTLRLVTEKNSDDVDALKKLLIRNLGYVQEHPLAPAVRQAAFQACAGYGKALELTPLLLKMCEPTPWQFYANVIMVLGNIASDEPAVRAVLENAAKDHNPEISRRAQSALGTPETTTASKNASSKKQTRLQKAIKSLKPSLQQHITIGMDEHANVQREDTPLPNLFGAPQEAKVTGIITLETPQEQKLEELIDRSYSAEALKRLYRNYLHDHLFTAANFKLAGKFTINKLKKSDITRALAKTFADKSLFLALFKQLPSDTQDILHALVWEGEEREVDTLEKQYKVTILKRDRKYGYGNSQDIGDAFVIFQVRSYYDWRSYRGGHNYSYHLSVADPFRKIFKTYLPSPKGYDIVPVATPEKTDFTYENQERILQHIKLYSAYIEQGNLKYSKSSGNLLKTSLNQMVKYCHIEEFYTGRKDLDSLKTQLIIDMLHGRHLPADQKPEDVTRHLMQLFFEKKKQDDNASKKRAHKYLYQFLYHLKGGYYEANYDKREKRVKRSLLKILKELPPMEWISVENIRQYCFYRDIFLDVAGRNIYGNDLFFTKKSQARYSSGNERVYVRDKYYKEGVIAPFINAMAFVLGTFGIVDIAYDWPKNDLLQERDNPYLSPFDGLRYLRLTALGAYALGFTKKYAASVQESTAKIALDEKRLIVTLEGRDPLKAMILEKIADQISENCYKVNYQSFLKDCVTKHDIKNKVTMFQEHINASPPQVWQEFLKDVQQKVNPLVSQKNMAIFKLKHNQELIALIARDSVLKQHILKAEDYHIVIAEKDISKVKKRLEEFGFFIDNI